jgi:hypothetical protein
MGLFKNLPEELYNAYLRSLKADRKSGDVKLFDWQQDCLYNTNILGGANLIYIFCPYWRWQDRFSA